jgi:hypothetical protein
MAGGYFQQLSDVKAWKVLSEDTFRIELVNFHGYRLPNMKSRNLKIRLIQTRLECKYGQCLLNYDELEQVIVRGVAMPKSTAA